MTMRVMGLGRRPTGDEYDRIEEWLREICFGVEVNRTTGEISIGGHPAPDGSEYISGCNCLAAMIASKKRVAIIPHGPRDPLPQSEYVLADAGGGMARATSHESRVRPDGTPGQGSNSGVFIDITNNNGLGYSHGAPMWLVLAHELTSGHASHNTAGTAATTVAESENQARTSENEHREEHGMTARPMYGEHDVEAPGTDIAPFPGLGAGGLVVPELPLDDEFQAEGEEGAEEEEDTRDEGGTGNGGLGGEVMISPEEGADDPRDLPPPVIYGEEIDPEDVLPLVFVPGFMGSVLRTRERVIWPPSWREPTLKPLYPGQPKHATPREGLYPGTYQPLLDFLRASGWQLGVNFWIFTYDWTQSCRLNGQNLRAFIDYRLEQANRRRRTKGRPDWKTVDVVNHSMGGIITRAAIELYAAPVRRTVYLASPHTGSPKAYFGVHPGIHSRLDEGFMKHAVRSIWWRLASQDEQGRLHQALKALAQALDPTYELLPDDLYLDATAVLTADTVAQMGVPATYYNGAWAFTRGQVSRVRRGMAFKKQLSDPPPQPHLVIFSESYRTLDSVEYRNRRFRRPTASSQGDRTVPKVSAARGNMVSVRGDHERVPNSPASHQHIVQYLRS